MPAGLIKDTIRYRHFEKSEIRAVYLLTGVSATFASLNNLMALSLPIFFFSASLSQVMPSHHTAPSSHHS